MPKPVNCTLSDLGALPPALDLATTARLLGLGMTKLREMVRSGEAPFPVLRLGAQYRVPTAPLLHVLGLDPSTAPPEARATAEGG